MPHPLLHRLCPWFFGPPPSANPPRSTEIPPRRELTPSITSTAQSATPIGTDVLPIPQYIRARKLIESDMTRDEGFRILFELQIPVENLPEQHRAGYTCWRILHATPVE